MQLDQVTTTSVPETEADAAERVVEQTIGLYRAGYMLSFGLVFLGLVIALIRDISLSAELGGPKVIISDVLDMDPNGFIGLGIGVMILTPILMSIEVALNFFRARDLRFGYITAAVASILVVTMILAFL
jgi:uncharacterized membrane protein